MPRTIPSAAIVSNNNIETNYQTSLVALRGAEMAPYFTRGTKAYFKNQIAGKDRNGQVYGFVIRDAGEVENSLAVGGSAKTDVVERVVNLSIEPWHIMVKTNAVEGKTDLEFDKEVAEPNGVKLINGALKKAIANDIPKSATCFIGDAGKFEPLSLASAHLASITAEPLFAYCDSTIHALATSKGAQFVPVGAPNMYKQGLLGEYHGAIYYAQRFMKTVKIDTNLATAMAGAVYSTFSANKLTITLGSNAAANFVVKKGTPFFVEGVVACDLVGDETATPYAFICNADTAVTSGASSIQIPVDEVPVALGGTRVASMDNGDEVVWTGGSATLSSANAVSCPAAGTYYAGLMRASGTYEFETLDDIDVATVDSKKGSVEGITIFQNRLVDLSNMINDTRFDLFTIAGTVEKRGQSLILIKA